jgi:hypothetical protein
LRAIHYAGWSIEEKSLPHAIRAGNLSVMLGASLFRDPADISKASPARGIGVCTIAAPQFLFGHDLFHDR